MKKYKILSILGVATIISSCGGDDHEWSASEVLPTSQISAEINVSSEDSDKVFITAQLREGALDSNTFVLLHESETLIASVGHRLDTIKLNDNLFNKLDALSERQKIMNRQIWSNYFFGIGYVDLSNHWYYTDFNNVNGETRYYVSLYRNGPHADVTNTYVDIPAPFSITSPIFGGNELYSRSTDDIPVTWTPFGSNASITVYLTANCENGESATLTAEGTDTGSMTIAANTVDTLTGLCTYAIRVEKRVLGNLDGRYGRGGIIRGNQSRSVTVNTTN